MPASAQVACPHDRPCITEVFIAKSDALMVRVNSGSRPGREGGQSEHAGRRTSLIKVLSSTTAGVRYTVSVQGCNRRVLQSSRCSDWHTASVKAH